MNIDFIILAAGKGTRMGGNSPKVLANLAGKPMIQHLIDTVETFPKAKTSVIVGHKAKEVENSISSGKKINYVIQKNQLGTAHAVKQAIPLLRKNSVSVVLYGDAPLVTRKTLHKLVNSAASGRLALLSYKKEDPSGYGRIVRGPKQNILKIIEHKDAASKEREISEVNSGILAVKTTTLQKLLPNIKNNNAAKEYYLTDLIEIANKHSIAVRATICEEHEVGGANSKQELHDLERSYQKRLAESLLAKDVLVADTSRLDIRGNSQIGKGSFIDINNVFEGQNKIGKNVHIGPNCHIINSTIKDNTVVYSNTCLLYTSPSPRDYAASRMPSSA